MTRQLAALLVLIFAAGRAAAGSDPATPTQIDGMDWSLPASVGLSAHGGVWGDEWDAGLPDLHAVFTEVSWRDLNPAPGVFDFGAIDQVLARSDDRLILRVDWYGACSAPGWARDDLRVMSDRTLVFWDESYRAALAPLARALGKRYAANPRLDALYLGFGDGQRDGPGCDGPPDGWGEFWMTDAALAEAEARFGLTPARLTSASKKLIDLFAGAFGQHAGKLAFTNIIRFQSGSDAPYNRAVRALAPYLARRGVGMRNGEIETWGRYIDTVFGARLTPAPGATARLSTDESFARGIGNRHWGDENEFYGPEPYVTEVMGPYSNQGYRFYVSSLRSLQMRYNHIAILPDALAALPTAPWDPQGLVRYQARTLGRGLTDTPDAFSMLGERYVRGEYLQGELAHSPALSGGMLKIRGVERWLAETGDSEPAMRIDMPDRQARWGQYTMPYDIAYEYGARAARVFHFDLHDQLARARCTTACPVAIKVSYLGTPGGAETLRVETQDATTPALSLSRDTRIHTATFRLTSRFAGALEHNGDIVLRGGGGAVTVLMVRLVFE